MKQDDVTSKAAIVIASIRSDVQGSGASNTAGVRAVRRQWSTRLKSEPAPLVLAVVKDLVRSGARTDRLVGFELLRSHGGAFAQLNDARIESLARGLADWGSIDLFGVTVTGPAWQGRLLSDAKVRAWARSSDRWRRRLALVSTVALNSRARGGSGDPHRTLAVCRPLMADRDDMVVKALSWALRELAKREPALVTRLLEQERDSLAPRVRREVANKLQTGVKQPARVASGGRQRPRSVLC